MARAIAGSSYPHDQPDHQCPSDDQGQNGPTLSPGIGIDQEGMKASVGGLKHARKLADFKLRITDYWAFLHVSRLYASRFHAFAIADSRPQMT